jgi:hypothetical protein
MKEYLDSIESPTWEIAVDVIDKMGNIGWAFNASTHIEEHRTVCRFQKLVGYEPTTEQYTYRQKTKNVWNVPFTPQGIIDCARKAIELGDGY